MKVGKDRRRKEVNRERKKKLKEICRSTCKNWKSPSLLMLEDTKEPTRLGGNIMLCPILLCANIYILLLYWLLSFPKMIYSLILHDRNISHKDFSLFPGLLSSKPTGPGRYSYKAYFRFQLLQMWAVMPQGITWQNVRVKKLAKIKGFRTNNSQKLF